ncbi:hypothetical protein JTE90_025711 [Oedothorax gibbosus]|uniref:SEC14-like protein 2 n=1 Tax=Oedothorax gibbosus TaxID=931172 RepID=A0AAV6UI78_9ARAC|nr:hypothetical protein JTE90_025711 [Oedothorax gibbosus]
MHWSESMTEEQKITLEEFRELTIKECTPMMLEDDSLFHRFMKARDFNLNDALEMFRNHLMYRKEYQIDTIVTDYKTPEVMEKYAPVTLLGYDKEGDSVKYLDLGRCDARGFIHSAKKMDLIKFNLQMHERDIITQRERSKKLGIHARKIVFIINFDELTLANATYKKGIDMLILAAKIMQANYPETIKHMFIIHVSVYFSFLYSFFKPFFAPALQSKVEVFESDGYQEALLKIIDADVIPAFLGGSRTDPDGNPNCYTIVKWGQPLPEKYRLRKSEHPLSASPGVQRLSVTRSSKLAIKFEVQEPDSFLEWEFETKSRDIGFGIYFQDTQESNREEVLPKQRIETDLEPEVGIYKCTKVGTYIIEFDNSHSWFHAKEVFYKVRIVKPEEVDVLDEWS